MYLFYEEAYETLAQKHDASKGAYKRPMRTGLSTYRMKAYLSEFCEKSYVHQLYDFTEQQMQDVFSSMHIVKDNTNKGLQENVCYEDFVHDITDNLCLLYLEGGKYHFSHRSFQEYFCAVYFSGCHEENFLKIGKFFASENYSKRESDKTFEMLVDMKTNFVEKQIFVPFLEALETKVKQQGIRYYLKKYFPKIESSYKDIPIEDSEGNWPASPILKTILEKATGYYVYAPLEMSLYPSWVVRAYSKGQRLPGSEYDNYLLEGDMDDDEYSSFFVDWSPANPNISGYFQYFDLKSIYDRPEEYKDLIQELETSVIAKDYSKLMEYKDKISKDTNDEVDDLDDIF